MTNRISRRALACALLASTALSLPTIAGAATPAPKFVDTIDDHGVDLATGLPFLTIEEGGIGSGPGRVAMQRIWSEDAGWMDNWSGGLFTKTTSLSGSTTFVEIDGVSETFSQSGGVYTNEKGDGATLVQQTTGDLLFTERDGTTILFHQANANMTVFSCPGADPNTCQNPLQITRPNGLVFTLAWNQWRQCLTTPPPGETCSDFQLFQRLSSVTSSAGYSLAITYGSDTPPGLFQNTAPPSSWFQRESVAFGNSANPPSPAPTIAYAYPSSTEVDATDPAGRKWVFTLDGSGRITGVQRPGSSSNNISYAYGADGTISSSTKDGVTNSYFRSVVGTTATETRTDPLTHQRVVTADTGVGRPSSDKDELNRTTSYAYDGSARLTKITAPEGNAVQYGYDARGNVTTTTNIAKPGSGLANIVTSASFDASCGNIVKCNKPNSTTDAKGNITTYAYDPTHGGVTSITQPAPASGAVQPQTRYSYTQITGAAGNLVYMLTGVSACQATASCSGGADETKVTATYNSNLLPTSVTRENGTGTLAATSALTYDPRGNLLSVDGPLSGTGDTTAYKYDSADQLTGLVSPDPDGSGSLPNRAIRLTYRPDGQVSKEEVGTTAGQSDADFSAMSVSQTVDIAFDPNAHPVQQKLSSGGTAYALTQADYDSLGRLNCTATRMNTAVYGSLPASACTLSTQGSFGPDRISQNLYDAAGELTDLKVAVGTADAATERHLAYTSNGLIASLEDGENNLTTYVYDGFDRLAKTEYPSPTKGAGTSNANDFEQLGYDANSNVTSRRLRDGTSVTLQYDDLDRLTTEGPPNPEATATFAYDNLGRLTSAVKGGSSLTFGYDALSRLTSEAGPQGTVTSAYDLAGRRTQLTYPGTGLFVNYDYLTTGEIAKVRENGATSGLGVLATYGYDNLGNRTSAAFGNTTSESFGYDPVSRLSSLSIALAGTASDLTKTFAYNPASQIVTETRSNDAYSQPIADGTQTVATNGLNQIATVNGTAAAYDALGNMTTDAATGKSYAYWSSNNQLRTVTSPFASLSYDALDRLWSIGNGGMAATKYLSDAASGSGSDTIAEYDINDVLQKRYVFDGSGGPLVQIDAAGTRTWMLPDERGSIVAQANDSGAMTAIDTYDEYGVPGASNSGTFQYTGQMWLSSAGFYNYRARVYAQDEGVFAQPDPIRQLGGSNIYGAMGGDPVNLVDPLGLDTKATPDFTYCGNGCYIDANGEVHVIGTAPPPPILSTIMVSANPNTFFGGSFFAGGGLVFGLPTTPVPTHSQSKPQQQQQCPTGTLGKVRNDANEIAKIAGGAGAVLALAGAIPSPATPVLESAAALATGANRIATGVTLGADLLYAIETGQTTALGYDTLAAFVGEIPLGTAGNKVQELTGREGSKFGEELGNRGMFAVSVTLPNPCG